MRQTLGFGLLGPSISDSGFLWDFRFRDEVGRLKMYGYALGIYFVVKNFGRLLYMVIDVRYSA